MAASKPTFLLSEGKDTFHPLTLSLHFGTLTLGWVVPLSDMELTPMPPLQSSTMIILLEFDKVPRNLFP